MTDQHKTTKTDIDMKKTTQTFKWKCDGCTDKSKRSFGSIADAARDALTSHGNHSQNTYVVGSKTGYVGLAYGLNFNMVA